MVNEQLVRRVLWAATAVVLVAGVLSAAVKGADDSGDRVATSAGSGSSTTASPAAGDAGTPTTTASSSPAAGADPAQGQPSAPATPTTAKPSAGAPGAGGSSGSGSSDTTAPASTPSDFRDLGPVDDPGATSVPAAGRYPYRFTDDTGEAHEAFTTVEDKGAQPAGGRRMVITFSGEGIDLINDVSWGPQDVKHLKTTFVFGETRMECDWEPDYVQMPLALSRGKTWESRATCTARFGGTTAVINRTTTTKVTDARRVHVAGGEVLTWLIEAHDRIDFPGQGTLDTRETTWFAPKLGLPVRQLGETTTSDPNDNDTSSELVITRLTPA